MTAAMICAIGLIGTSVHPRRLALVGGLVLVAVSLPLLLVPAGLACIGVTATRRVRARTARLYTEREDLAALAELTAIGLTGGLGVQAALAIAARCRGGAIRAEVETLLRRARIDGIAATMATAEGIGRDLYRAIGRAATTGATLLDPVVRIAADSQADLAAERLQAVRRIPVAMLFPLTLLILPGFLLLTVAPALLEAFGRLEI